MITSFIARTVLSEAESKDVQNWATFNSLKHTEVQGVWNKFAEKTDIVNIDVNVRGGVIAAGDEHGLIKLFRFPSEKRGAHFRKYVGHSSRIGRVERSASDGNHLSFFFFFSSCALPA